MRDVLNRSARRRPLLSSMPMLQPWMSSGTSVRPSPLSGWLLVIETSVTATEPEWSLAERSTLTCRSSWLGGRRTLGVAAHVIVGGVVSPAGASSAPMSTTGTPSPLPSRGLGSPSMSVAGAPTLSPASTTGERPDVYITCGRIYEQRIGRDVPILPGLVGADPAVDRTGVSVEDVVVRDQGRVEIVTGRALEHGLRARSHQNVAGELRRGIEPVGEHR